MPKIYEYIGYIIFFYSNEHLPVHCHIKKQQREVKAVIEYNNGKPFVTFMKVRSKNLLSERELNDIEEFILKKHNQIVNKWTDFFVKGKNPSVEKINKKL